MSDGKYRDLLCSFGFQAFLWTQFLGAFNDNLYKIVVSMIAVAAAARYGGGSGYLSLVGAVFILPFFFFSGYAGHLADVTSKRTVLVATKAFEIVAMGLALWAFRGGRIEPMLGVLFLMALQSTFFSPAKYGILPEMLPDRDLSRANGLLEMTTFLAIILGTSLGGLLFAAWKGRLEWIGLVLVAIALAGALAGLGITRVPPSGARKPFRWNPWAEISDGLGRLYRQKPLWRTVVGISYFWFMGALLQMALILLGKEVMGLDDFRVGLLAAYLAVGIGVGSLAAGRLSGDKVELGLVPLGSIGMGLFSVWLSFSTASYGLTAAALVLLGFSGGFFIVPLNALLQQKSGAQERGRLIATANFLNMGGVLLASGVLWALRDGLQVPADRIIGLFGFFTLAATVYLLTLLPDFLIRFTLWLLTHTLYRIRIVGQEHVPFRGPALLVCNHLSYVDGFLVGACLQRFVRFMVYKPYYEMRAFHWLLHRMKAIPVMGGDAPAVEESLERAREELRQGHVVCIFAEGAVSRTGNLLPFKRGFERIMRGLDVPIIPVHLDRLWGSIFSFKDGKVFWKWPERLPYPVTVSFGRPMASAVPAPMVTPPSATRASNRGVENLASPSATGAANGGAEITSPPATGAANGGVEITPSSEIGAANEGVESLMSPPATGAANWSVETTPPSPSRVANRSVEIVRQAILELGCDAVEYRKTPGDLLPRRFIETAKRRWLSFCMADSSGKKLTYGEALVTGLALARRFREELSGETSVGILLPASVDGALANIAASLAGKVPVNLDFTAGAASLMSAVEQCRLRTMVTSRAFLQETEIEAPDGILTPLSVIRVGNRGVENLASPSATGAANRSAEITPLSGTGAANRDMKMVFVEETMRPLSFFARTWVAVRAFLLPAGLLWALEGGGKTHPDAMATVIFSRGSTGTPRGVMLSHYNVLSNIEGLAQLFWVNRKDRLMGVFPFSQALGFTGTLWLPLLAGFGVVYHADPLDATTIGALVSRHRATILLGAPRFYAAYQGGCTAEAFSSLRYAVVGGDKLEDALAVAFEEKYGLELLEGYGCTEMGSVIAVNVPDYRKGAQRQVGVKGGTVGHPLPGVAAKVVDPDMGDPLPAGREGLLLVRGPNRMIGYLGRPEETKAVLRNGWYVTGDIASIDADGFLRITESVAREGRPDIFSLESPS